MIIRSQEHLNQKSPYDLIQERYLNEPWKIMIVCIMLNLTRGRQVKDVINTFFEKYPTPNHCANAKFDELSQVVRSLGMWQRRTLTLIKFSKDWSAEPWTNVTDLYGIGGYARDAWSIFVDGQVPEPELIKDGKLKLYAQWARDLVKAQHA